MLYPTVTLTPSKTVPLVASWTDADPGVKQVRLDCEAFPDFWLTGLLDLETKCFKLTGGRFSTSWHPSFSHKLHTHFDVETTEEQVTIACLGTTVSIPL